MNATAQHTPGPWHDDGYRVHGPTADPDPRNGRVLMEAKHLGAYNPADLTLAAAAPDLLAACKEILRVWMSSQCTVSELDAAYDAIHTAIARAEGATHA